MRNRQNTMTKDNKNRPLADNTESFEYANLRSVQTLLNRPVDLACEMAAHLVDGAWDRGSERDLEHAQVLIKELQQSNIPDARVSELHYFAANTWSALRTIRRTDSASQWVWMQPELEQELLALRRAIYCEGFSELNAVRCAQMYTNAGNLLNTIGRPLDAVRLYNHAIQYVPNFGMAIGNRALALKGLAQYHYDHGQACLLLHRSRREFSSVAGPYIEIGADLAFQEQAEQIESWLDQEFLQKDNPFPRVSLGRSKTEKSYREWALTEGLFLNPLIALGPESCAARDTLGLPSLTTPINDGPGLLGMFTQIKQEFISARYMAWEGVVSHRPHFSDRETHLVDTLDYAVYGLGIEKLKMAFRMAYSILDKCAFFLNKYLDLQIDDNNVNLNRVWFVDGEPNRSKENGNLNSRIMDSENWPLRGLFWLARDIYDKGALRDPIDPMAQELKVIRDHLEHKYLKVHEFCVERDTPNGLKDQYSWSIDVKSLESKSLSLLRHAHSAVTNLALAVHAEEKIRTTNQSSTGLKMPMFLPLVPDNRKR